MRIPLTNLDNDPVGPKIIVTPVGQFWTEQSHSTFCQDCYRSMAKVQTAAIYRSREESDEALEQIVIQQIAIAIRFAEKYDLMEDVLKRKEELGDDSQWVRCGLV